MFDSSSLQAIAHGTVTTAATAAGTASGCIVAKSGGPGTGLYTITLNAKAGSEHADAAATRCIATATVALAGVSVVKTSDSVFTVTCYVGAAGVNVATDETFDFVIFRDPTVTV